MEHPFDPTLKTLAELSPADWLPLAGRRRRRRGAVLVSKHLIDHRKIDVEWLASVISLPHVLALHHTCSGGSIFSTLPSASSA
jgi:hypothetical protein